MGLRSTGNNHAGREEDQGSPVLPGGCFAPEAQERLRSREGQAPRLDHPGHGPHCALGQVPRQAGCLPQAAHLGPASGHGPLQGQRCPPQEDEPGVLAATSTKVDGVSSIAAEVSDDLFKKVKKKSKSKKSSEDFFANQEEEEKPELSDDFKALQKQVDDALVPLIKKTDDLLASYLKTPFTLSKGQYPHMIKF